MQAGQWSTALRPAARGAMLNAPTRTNATVPGSGTVLNPPPHAVVNIQRLVCQIACGDERLLLASPPRDKHGGRRCRAGAPELPAYPVALMLSSAAVEGIAGGRGLARPSIVDVVVVSAARAKSVRRADAVGSLVRTTWIQRTLSPDGSLPAAVGQA